MQIKKFIEEIQKHKDGVTIDLNGNIPSLKGFAVSITDNKINANLIKDGSISGFIKSLVDQASLLNSDDVYIGSWFNPDDNHYYIDVTLNTQNEQEALTLSKTFKQKAYFNFNNFQVVNVN